MALVPTHGGSIVGPSRPPPAPGVKEKHMQYIDEENGIAAELKEVDDGKHKVTGFRITDGNQVLSFMEVSPVRKLCTGRRALIASITCLVVTTGVLLGVLFGTAVL